MGTTMARGLLLLAFVAALAVTVVASDEATSSTEDLKTMSREQLMSALQNSRSVVEQSKQQLKKATDKIGSLKDELEALTDDDEYETNRKSHEKTHKLKVKKKQEAKREKKIQKKEKLSDMLLENAAKFLAFQAAKKTANKGSTVQKAAILEAARNGGRAGALGPLKKVVRSAAVQAVKKARVAAKKAGTHGKHAIRKISVQAAKDAVNKLIAEQDALVEAAAQKFLKQAVKKHPPSVFLAEDDGKPNHFTAPPSIHLSLDGNAPAQVEMKAPAPKKKAVAKKVAAKVKKAAAAAKQDAATIVPETKH